ncbi:MAG TPA: hypothetical protein VMT58_05735, partial [Candidatus Binataceae bacterium]|nr:hypothetical protein [Candidatus Binataceae bacterium]
VVAPVHGPRGEGILFDAAIDETFVRRWLQLMEQGRESAMQQGRLRGFRLSSYDAIRGAEPIADIKRLDGEQSNTSFRLGWRMMLKLYRRFGDGVNPDFEVLRYLTEDASFARIPRAAGAVQYERDGKEPVTVTLVQEWVENQGNGWTYTLDELGRFYDRVIGQFSALQPVGFKQGLPTAGESATLPARAQELIGPYLQSAAILGKRTAELHRALAGAAPANAAFAAQPLTDAYLAGVCERIAASSRNAMDALKRKLPDLPAPLQAKAQSLLDARSSLTCVQPPRLSNELPRGRIRTHGDYHLAQVVWSNNDFIIVDFEGEPLRSLRERREKQSPLRDVAGMLRSFHYAAYSALFKAAADRPADFEKLDPAAAWWASWAVSRFVRAYRETLAGAGLAPDDSKEFQTLLNLFLLEKTLYEIQYELDNRPTWLGIPIAGALAVIGEPALAASA